MAMATMRPPMKSMQEDFMKYMLVWAVVIIPKKKSCLIIPDYQSDSCLINHNYVLYRESAWLPCWEFSFGLEGICSRLRVSILQKG
jgi:hypothetical protein